MAISICQDGLREHGYDNHSRTMPRYSVSGSLAFGERVSFNSRSAWQEWTHPVGSVELQATGRIQPVPVRKNIDAVRNAEDFGGGIRSVGSNARDAGPHHGWRPSD